jgi:Tol biopolymer transport system component
VTNLPTLNFLTSDASFTDYRPTMNATGDTVIFERTPVPDGGSPTTLQMIDDFSNPNPVPFLSGSPPASQTRPDWCWATGDVLFNGATSNSASVSVWRVGSDGANPTPITGTTDAYYPKWGLEGTEFVTENSSPAAAPRPCNTVFNLKGIPIAWNINGKIPAGWIPTYGGMPAVMASGLFNICYAGEPAIPNWNGPNTGLQYNENNNYIFLNKQTPNGITTMPMEAGASVSAFDPNYEGRAPDVSPDGSTIVFESNRPPGGGNNYAIYLFNLATSTVTQVTDPSLNGQHAKFFPDGTKLIVTINHPNATPPTRGIAWIDISGLL